jgi:predicted solute-binding protein
MTGLPFVWAFWSGRPDAAGADAVAVLVGAAAEGQTHLDAIAAAYCASEPDRIPIAVRYLRTNLMFDLSERARAGLAEYYARAARLGLIRTAPDVRFF